MRVEQLAKLFRAASNEKRMHIIRALMNKDMTINRLSDHTGLPYKTVERHLKILAAVNIVKPKRSGLEIIFALNTDLKDHFRSGILNLVGGAK